MPYKLFTAYIIAFYGSLVTFQKTAIRANEPCLLQSDSLAIAPKLLTLKDAEKIMGEPAKLTDKSFIKKGDTLEYKCEYTALSQDGTTNKTGKLYFMYEVYLNATAATNAYTAIYQSNSGHEGVEVVPGLGSEAYYHTDQTGFYFFLVRKNEKMIRLKLNKITSHSSATRFKEVTRHVVGKL